jgi:hypothetical protein
MASGCARREGSLTNLAIVIGQLNSLLHKVVSRMLLAAVQIRH